MFFPWADRRSAGGREKYQCVMRYVCRHYLEDWSRSFVIGDREDRPRWRAHATPADFATASDSPDSGRAFSGAEVRRGRASITLVMDHWNGS